MSKATELAAWREVLRLFIGPDRHVIKEHITELKAAMPKERCGVVLVYKGSQITSDYACQKDKDHGGPHLYNGSGFGYQW